MLIDNSKIVVRSLCLMVFLTNIAMLQNIFSEAMAYLPILSVVIVIIVLCITQSVRYINHSALCFLMCVVIFILGVLLLEITGQSYLSANLTYPNILCAVLFLIGFFSEKHLSKESIRTLLFCFVISTLIVSVIVYLEFYVGFQWGLRYSEYKFRGQLSQAIMFSVFAMITNIRFDSKILRFAKVIVVAFFGLLLLMMKCRATLVEIVIGIIVLLFFKGTSKKIKNLVIGIIIIFGIALVVSTDLRNLIINDVILFGRSFDNLDDISSGRISILNSFPELWSGHEFIGIGKYYFECFPLNALLQYGIIIGAVAIFIGIYPFVWIWKNRNSIVDIEFCGWFFMSSAACVVCGLFEAIAPVGPGIKFYILWLMFGIVMARRDSELA